MQELSSINVSGEPNGQNTPKRSSCTAVQLLLTGEFKVDFFKSAVSIILTE
jgi:hypothetical protein